MDEREQLRKVRHRLAMLRHAEEVRGNVAATCRYYGISRQLYHKWHRRYEELGEALAVVGAASCDASRPPVPCVCPRFDAVLAISTQVLSPTDLDLKRAQVTAAD